MSEIKYIGQMSSSQNSRIIDPEGISYAMANGEKDGTPKIIEALAVGRERTEEEKKRRRIHGDKGAKFSQGKQMCLLDDVSGCLTTMPNKDNLVGEIYNKDVAMTKEPIIIDDYNQRVPQDQDVIGTVTTQFGNPAPRHGYKIAEPLRIPQATKQGYIEVPQGAVFDMSYPESTTRRGRVQEGGQVSPTLMAGGEAPCYFEGVEAKVFKEGNYHKSGHNASSIVNPKGLSPTVMENHGTVTATIEPMSYRIRKLTPRECFRLMGVTEADIDKIQQSGVSQSQQYKMAGNSIVVDVLVQIFRKMFVDTGQESQQLSLF